MSTRSRKKGRIRPFTHMMMIPDFEVALYGPNQPRNGPMANLATVTGSASSNLIRTHASTGAFDQMGLPVSLPTDVKKPGVPKPTFGKHASKKAGAASPDNPFVERVSRTASNDGMPNDRRGFKASAPITEGPTSGAGSHTTATHEYIDDEVEAQ